MNDDNKDFDRFNHDDYDNLGYRKPIGSSYIRKNDEEEESYYKGRRFDKDGNDVSGPPFRLTIGSLFMIAVFIVIALIAVMNFLNSNTGGYSLISKECLSKAEEYLKTKYNMSGVKIIESLDDRADNNYCDLVVTTKKGKFNIIFDKISNSSIYDNYQEKEIIDAIKNELSKYNANIIDVRMHNTFLDNDRLKRYNYFNEAFDGKNFNKLFNGYTVDVFIDGDLPEEVVKFASVNSIDNINFVSLKNKEAYKASNDIDSYSLYVNKLIEIKNRQISKYKYDVLNIEGINLVFKGHTYSLKEKPTYEKTKDGCYDIKYKGYKEPDDGIFRGNLLNVFSESSSILYIEGTNYITEQCNKTDYCKTKIGVPNGIFKVCIQKKDE